MGSIELDDGTFAQGFLCESDVITDAVDISHHGGWRAYLRAKDAPSK
jgi:allophanate hydrolase